MRNDLGFLLFLIHLTSYRYIIGIYFVLGLKYILKMSGILKNKTFVEKFNGTQQTREMFITIHTKFY